MVSRDGRAQTAGAESAPQTQPPRANVWGKSECRRLDRIPRAQQFRGENPAASGNDRRVRIGRYAARQQTWDCQQTPSVVREPWETAGPPIPPRQEQTAPTSRGLTETWFPPATGGPGC